MSCVLSGSIRERMVGPYKVGTSYRLMRRPWETPSRMGSSQVSKKPHPAISNVRDPKSLKPGETGIPEGHGCP